jgi:predicted phage baseplate assembly protein
VLDIVGLPEEGKSKGQIKWHLKDKNGFIGFVSTEPDELVPEPETLKDEPVNQARSGSDTEETVSEVIFLDSMEVNDDLTTLVFTANLQNVYRRESVTIYGNVAASTHGETKAEVLGSGDGSKAFQKFSLKQKPLTYISAPTPNGVKSTLEIRVNDILWEEEPSFYRLSPKKRAYITKMNDDGTVTVQFGDGITGTRLPTGIENVKATYRVGTGLNGMVDANQLSLLMTRPLGVKEVINPLAATGADDPEQRDQARKNAPLTVLTLDRIVSLQDFEDFARSFSGIGKAQAGLVWNGEKELVHITVAAADGGEVDKNSNLYKNLVAGIDSARHSYQNIQIDSYIPLLFNVQAKVLVDSAYLVENVLMEVSIAIKDTFDFEHRGLGEAVTASDVMVVMQQTKGVVAVDLDTLEFMNNVDKSEVKYGPFPMKTIKSKKVFSSLRLASRLVTRTRGKIDLSRIKPKRTDLDLRLPAHTARWDKNTKTIKAAELLIVNPEGIKLTGTTV